MQSKACTYAVLKVSQLGEFDAAVKAWLGAVEAAAAKAAKNLAFDTLTFILKESPQYSGDFVANWNTTLDTPDYTMKQNAVGGESYFQGKKQATFQKGSNDAILYAQKKAIAALSQFKLGRKIYLANGAYHQVHIQRYKGDKLAYEGPGGREYYGWKLENGLIKLRPVNQGADHMVRRSLTHHQNIYRNISASQLASMKVF